MRIIALLLLAVAVALGVFAWWGMSTESGRRRFDEMAGMIPYFAMIAAVAAGLIGAIILVTLSFRK